MTNQMLPGVGVSLLPCNCWTCKVAAPSWRTFARKLFPGASITGEGAWVLLSCAAQAVRLFETRDEAHSELIGWRYMQCEPYTGCSGDAGHRIFEMRRS